jgi:hypothetical protein
MAKAKPRRKTKAADKSKRAAEAKPGRAAANQAAGKNAERLRELGAHAISIKPGASEASGHVIEVYVPEDFKGTMPKQVSTTVRGKKVEVPVKVKKKPRFKPEKL